MESPNAPDRSEKNADFQIFGGGSSLDAATGLHVALRQAGFESRHLMSNSAEWLTGFGSGSQLYGELIRASRLTIFFYSEDDARSHQVLKLDEFLTGYLAQSLLQANCYAPTLVVVTDGAWPLAPSPIPVIPVPKGGAAELVALVFRIWGVAFFARKLEEDQQAELARLFRNGLEATMGGRKLHAFVFGPGQPAKTFSAMLSFEGLLWNVREGVRGELDACGVASVYGEDLDKMSSSRVEREMNPSLKERIFATQVDVIVFLAGSVGSAAELGVFSQHPELCSKCHIWVCDEHQEGFLAKGPAQECLNFGASLEVFSRADLETRRLEQRVMEGVRRRLEALAATRFGDSAKRKA